MSWVKISETNNGIDMDKVREKIIEAAKRLISEGKDIYAGYYSGGDPANVQLSFTRHGENTFATYSYYDRMFNYTIPTIEIHSEL